MKNLAGIISTFDNLALFLTGYLALGLIEGVCGLGIMSSRAVAERRQQIGILRSIGYGRLMVAAAFLLETGFIVLFGLVIGVSIGFWSGS